MTQNSGPKILVYDVETSPNLGYVWGKWQQNVIDFQSHWYMLCFAYKWLDDPTIHFESIYQYDLFDEEPENDLGVVTKLHELFDEADAVVAHNGNSFDNKKTMARFLYHGMKPPSPFKQIDTKLMAKRHFRLCSNSLNDICKYLGLETKVQHNGFDLWKGCMAGDPESWLLMEEYNIQDVALLEEVYLKLLPYCDRHPNMGLWAPGELVCPNCGSYNVQKRGFSKTTTLTYQRFQCNDCGKYSRDRLRDKGTKPARLR